MSWGGVELPLSDGKPGAGENSPRHFYKAGGTSMRIDSQSFLEFMFILMSCIWLTIIYLNNFQENYGKYGLSML